MSILLLSSSSRVVERFSRVSTRETRQALRNEKIEVSHGVLADSVAQYSLVASFCDGNSRFRAPMDIDALEKERYVIGSDESRAGESKMRAAEIKS